MKHLLLILFFIPLFSWSQQVKELTNEERAYLYHTVKNSPILNNHFGKYFEYKGPEILFPNKEINKDSLETFITLFPDSLIIYTQEIAKAPKGLVIEASNKMALWDLNRILMAKRGTPSELEPYKNDYEVFASILVKNLPPAALQTEDGKLVPHTKLDNVLNPQMSFDDKTAILGSYQFLNTNDQLVTINAITNSINQYIELRTREIFLALNGCYSNFKNIIIAAGDGSVSSSNFEDRESSDKSKWVNGLPKTVGLIPFQAKYSEANGSISAKIDPLTVSTSDFTTAGDNKITNLHIDVWGYNPEKQVTVIIEKNGLCYPLFNSGKTRFLSPDSTFEFGGTYKQRMNDLEFKKIKDLIEMVYGKRGFDHWIAYNNKKKDQTELLIIKLEKRYSDFGYSPVEVSKKKSKKNVKRSKNDNSRLENYSLSDHSEADERSKTQHEIVRQHAIFDEYKRKIKELEIQKKQALELLALYQRRLDDYKMAFGQKWAKYKKKDGIYTFEDSSTFNIFTQEFQFPAKGLSEQFEVRNISIPEDCLSNIYDETMLHINVVDEIPFYDAKINVQLIDQFPINKWNLEDKLFTQKDSVALMELAQSILTKKLKITANGNGIGKWNGSRVIKDITALNSKKTTLLDSTSAIQLNKTELIATLNNEVSLTVSSFTDDLISGIEINNPKLQTLITLKKATKNDFLTAYRTQTVLAKFKSEFCTYVTKNLSVDEANKIIRKLNKTWSKIKINIGSESIKLSDLN